jgi:hypothetical protein
MLFHAPKLRILKLGPMIKLMENNLEYNLAMKIDSENFDSYSNLEELWLTFQHTEMSDHLLKVLKLTLCSAPNLKKFVLEVMSNPCMRANFPMYRQLAAFCEVHMPDVEVIRIC